MCFRRKEELGMDVLSLNMQDIWVETLSRRLDWCVGTENKGLNVVSPRAVVENVGMANK